MQGPGPCMAGVGSHWASEEGSWPHQISSHWARGFYLMPVSDLTILFYRLFISFARNIQIQSDDTLENLRFQYSSNSILPFPMALCFGHLSKAIWTLCLAGDVFEASMGWTKGVTTQDISCHMLSHSRTSKKQVVSVSCILFYRWPRAWPFWPSVLCFSLRWLIFSRGRSSKWWVLWQL